MWGCFCLMLTSMLAGERGKGQAPRTSDGGRQVPQKLLLKPSRAESSFLQDTSAMPRSLHLLQDHHLQFWRLSDILRLFKGEATNRNNLGLLTPMKWLVLSTIIYGKLGDHLWTIFLADSHVKWEFCNLFFFLLSVSFFFLFCSLVCFFGIAGTKSDETWKFPNGKNFSSLWFGIKRRMMDGEQLCDTHSTDGSVSLHVLCPSLHQPQPLPVRVPLPMQESLTRVPLPMCMILVYGPFHPQAVIHEGSYENSGLSSNWGVHFGSCNQPQSRAPGAKHTPERTRSTNRRTTRLNKGEGWVERGAWA